MLCPACFQVQAGGRICPHCRFDEGTPRESRFLPLRHRLRRGRYTVGIVLGKPGGFGVAYKAYDHERSAVVVIKECLLTESGQVSREPGDPRLRINEGFRADHRRWVARFLAEGRLIQRFASPCIVRVIDVFEENGTACYVMPFVEGEDLVRHCARHGGALPEQEVLRIAQMLLPALAEIHASGFVHRDIKPSNVLITRNKHKPVLIDFGAARERFDEDRSRSHMAIHTRAYAPIEQILMRSDQGPWTDLYSLCATLHYGLVGAPPPDAANRKSGATDLYLPIQPRLPGLDMRLAALIDGGLVLQPEQRLRSAVAALRLLETGDRQPSPPPSPPPRTSRPPPPLPVWVGLMPAGALLAYGALGDGPLDRYLMGLPGLLVLANALGWGWWLARRRSAAPATANGPSTLTGNAAGDGPPVGPSTLGPIQTGDKAGAAGGIELQLQTDGVAPLVQRLQPGQTVVVGRTDKADLVVANDLLSGRHVSITVTDDGEFRLQDLGSLNHTFLFQRGAAGEPGAWRKIQTAAGRKGRFMLGPLDGGVRLDIQPAKGPR